MRHRNDFTFMVGLSVWLVVVLLTATAILSYTAPASAQQTSTLATPALTATASANGIDLSWTEVTGAARYQLWTWTNVDLWRQIGGDSLTGTSYTHSDVTVGTTYYYAIRAVNASGDTSAWSEYASVTVTASSAPTPAPSVPAPSVPTPLCADADRACD